MAPHQFNPTVLREYDIRGIVGDTLTLEDARALGRSFGTMIAGTGDNHEVCVGYDGRTSSPDMEEAIVEGLVSTGMRVNRVGMGPTPMLYFSVKHMGAAGGIMVTGSHNPPEYNGFKMLTQGGPLFGDAIQALGARAATGEFAAGMGDAERVDINQAYLEHLLAIADMPKPLKVVWDFGNGAAGAVAKPLLDKLPGEHVALYPEVDGTFPNHHPDPTVPKNLVDLQAAVAKHGADLGVAFDGDGDRIGAVDENGEILFGDHLIAIYASEILAQHPGGTVIADVKASQTLFDEIARLGGNPVMWKTGHSLIKDKMKELDAPLAGEMSGHIFFRDNYGFDDAVYCAIKLISIASKSGDKASKLVAHLPSTHSTPETRFQVDESRKFVAIEEVQARLKAQADLDVNDMDGVRVNTPDGWWLLRASNTQDVLVARAESTTEEGLERLKDMVRAQLAESGIDAPAEF